MWHTIITLPEWTVVRFVLTRICLGPTAPIRGTISYFSIMCMNSSARKRQKRKWLQLRVSKQTPAGLVLNRDSKIIIVVLFYLFAIKLKKVGWAMWLILLQNNYLFSKFENTPLFSWRTNNTITAKNLSKFTVFTMIAVAVILFKLYT